MVQEYSQNPLYCQSCDLTFAKQTVFNSHFTVKRQMKAIQKPQSSFKDV